jgi:hypothetical protein
MPSRDFTKTPAAPIAVTTSTTLPFESNTGALGPLMPGIGSPMARNGAHHAERIRRGTVARSSVRGAYLGAH